MGLRSRTPATSRSGPISFNDGSDAPSASAVTAITERLNASRTAPSTAAATNRRANPVTRARITFSAWPRGAEGIRLAVGKAAAKLTPTILRSPASEGKNFSAKTPHPTLNDSQCRNGGGLRAQDPGSECGDLETGPSRGSDLLGREAPLGANQHRHRRRVRRDERDERRCLR